MAKKQSSSSRRINQLIWTVVRLTILALALLTIRVVDLQGVRGEFFRQVSEQNRQFRVNLPAERGVFLDRFGQPLVINTRQYFSYDNPSAAYSPTTPLSQSEALQLQTQQSLSVGFNLQRQYLRPFSMAHVLGYTSVVNKQDLANNASFLLTDAVGRLGLEERFDEQLRGRDGYQEVEINALGEKLAVQREVAPQPGRSLQTTLDPYLSTVAWRAMGDKSGAVIILDAETGEVLSLVSTPSFNSNLFTPNFATADRQRISALQSALADERQLFFNRAISGLYPPGSTFKLVTAVAGLESKALDLNTTVDDQGVLEVNDFVYANWYYTQYGRVEGLISLVRAIARSNDTYFYKAAEWTGVEALAQKAREFGFGSLSGVEITGEKAGLVPDPAWKEKTFGERWFLGNTYHFGIGQGDLLVTPLQLAQMVAVFGNDGRLCESRLIKDAADQRNNCSSLGVEEPNLAAVQEGMISACSAGGTAFPFFDWNTRREQLPENLSPAEQIRRGVVACKTGTSEFGAADERGFRQTHGLFGMVIGGLPELLAEDLVSLSIESEEASSSVALVETKLTEAELDLNLERQAWLRQVQTHGLPQTLAIVVLIESDDAQPYAEGSREASPVARAIIDWLMGQPLVVTPVAESAETE
jgi:penicillin-binding protein 2